MERPLTIATRPPSRSTRRESNGFNPEGTLIAAGLSASSTSVPSKSRKSAASARSAAGGARSGTAMRPVGKHGGETQVALFQHLAGIGAPEMVGADIALAALKIEAAQEIGRATWQEREGQEVRLWGGAVKLKK